MMFWIPLRNNRLPLRAIAATLVVGFFLLSPHAAVQGAEENILPDCDFAPLLGNLAAIVDDPSPSTQDRIRAELGVRKELLRRTTQCAVIDASNIRSKVAEIPSADPSVTPLRVQFLSAIDDVLGHYADVERSIDTMGIGGTKDAARDLREWRTNTAAPLLGEALNFIVWAQNQDLFAAAEVRLTDMTRTLRSLRLHEEESIAELLAGANRNFADASALNAEVRTSLTEFPPAADTLQIIKESLSQLAGAYTNFFDLSEAAHKLLPAVGAQ